MNRFILADDPRDIPALMCDQHIVKMVTEEGQMLSTAIRATMPVFAAAHDEQLFRASYAKHPCTLWLHESFNNMAYAVLLFATMNLEYERRFKRQHGSFKRLVTPLTVALTTPEAATLPRAGLTPHPQCFGPLQNDCATDESWPVNAYRSYYQRKNATFRRPMRWTDTPTPTFMRTHT